MSETPQQYLTPTEVADLLQIPIATLYAWRYKGIGPDSVKVGRHIRYSKVDVEKWFDDKKQLRTQGVKKWMTRKTSWSASCTRSLLRNCQELKKSLE
ncbi:MAG: helix-turn-helix domain-containing protein [Acidimicrobiales bacterium]